MYSKLPSELKLASFLLGGAPGASLSNDSGPVPNV
jgi:hypothetical protein